MADCTMKLFLLILAVVFSVSSAKITGGTVTSDSWRTGNYVTQTYSLVIDADVPAGSTSVLKLDNGHFWEFRLCERTDFTSGDVASCVDSSHSGNEGTLTFREVKSPGPIRFSLRLRNSTRATNSNGIYYYFRGDAVVSGLFLGPRKLKAPGEVTLDSPITANPAYTSTDAVWVFPLKASEAMAVGEWIHILIRSTSTGFDFSSCATNGGGFTICEATTYGAKYKVDAPIAENTTHTITTTIRNGRTREATWWRVNILKGEQPEQTTKSDLPGVDLGVAPPVDGVAPPKKMGAVLLSPHTLYEQSSFYLEMNMTFPDGLDGIVPRNTETFLICATCWGLQLPNRARSYRNVGQTWDTFRLWTTVVGNHGPTRCEIHLEYKNKVIYRVYGKPGTQTGI
eukprot:Platyproteum_vivax@DN7609_c4_g1_i2.p1